MNKGIIIAITITFFIVIAIVFSKQNDNKLINKDVSSNNISHITSSDISQNKNDNNSQLQSINKLVVDFLKSYYNIHSNDNSKNYAIQHFNEYKEYMTQKCQVTYKPNEVSTDENQHIGMSYNLDLIRYKIYSDIDFSKGDNTTRVLCFVQTRTQISDIKPNISNALLNLEIKKENDKWLVDDIVINQLIDFPIDTNSLFN